MTDQPQPAPDPPPASAVGRRTSALVRAAAGGDERAWVELVDTFSGLVWMIARAHGLDQAVAAEVSQVVWLRLAENLRRISDPGHVGAWLASTSRQESERAVRAAAQAYR